MQWETRIVPGHAPDGAPILSVLGKKTYRFQHGKKAEPDPGEPIGFQENDQYYDEGDPLKNATKHETDLVAFKPLVDVVFHVCAHAPKGKKALYLDVGVLVGNARKVARVFGDRKVHVTGGSFAIGDSEPFDSLRLDYSRAYGGADKKSQPGTDFVYRKNPVGRGFVVRNDPAALQGLQLPNIEDPQALLSPGNLVLGKFEQWQRMPEPVSFGYTSRNFHPRLNLAGLNPTDRKAAEIQRQAHLRDMAEVGSAGNEPPPPPPLLNPEYFNGASPGLQFGFLKGDEPIKLRSMDPALPLFEFSLPGDKPALWLDVGNGRQPLDAALQTVEIFKETNQCTLLWRGSARYGGPESMKKFRKLEFGA